MAEVTLAINGRHYTVACDDGQEDHLRQLAAHIDEHARDLAASVGQIGESRLLVMASLLVADELADAYARVAQLEDGQVAPVAAPPANGASELAVAQAMESCTSQIEAIAASLEGT